ncbi:MAG: hypothetical protein R2682_13975 [Pyrinomonadaceae bacterium]
MARSLYICYFGVREPLVQTQVLPYLRELVAGGHEMTLLTFEPDLKAKWTSEQIDEMRERLAADGIAWHRLAYHKWPSAPATAWDVFAGVFRVRRLMRETDFDLLHCRAHIPALMAACEEILPSPGKGQSCSLTYAAFSPRNIRTRAAGPRAAGFTARQNASSVGS